MIRWLFKWMLQALWGDWQHVGILIVGVDETRRDRQYYFHCFESRFGHRRVIFRVIEGGRYNERAVETNIDADDRKRVYGCKIYQEDIYPWLHGRNCPKIPRYEQVKSNRWDFKKILKGETPIVLNDDEKQQ